nr:integrase, catalytic region, zinc finger, CCHC-type, peptidase aspartic, catalytic [Tanacetum cinerariifolium]
MSSQQDIYAAGFKNRPPILNKENYVPWSSRLLMYAKSRPVLVNETFYVQTDDELTEKELKQLEADDQAIQTILLSLPKDIYAAVDSCETAQEIWLCVQQMMKGSDIGIQEKKANQLKWSRHVTIVHQTKDLHTADYTQLYDFLKYNQKEVDDLKAGRLARTQDPLALMATSNNPYTFPVPYQDQPSFSQNYMQQPMPNPEGITDPTTAMNMALALMAKGFKLNYSTPTNNNQRISSNPRNSTECRELGYSECNSESESSECWKSEWAHWDAAYLQTQLLIAQKKEAGIQLQAGEFDLMAAAADLDEIEEVNANYGSVEVHNYENCYDNEIFNMFTQEEHRTTSANAKETRVLYDSLYHNLATKVEKVNMVNQKTLQLAQESRQKIKQLNKEIKPTNYTKINHLSGVFVSQTANSREELYFSNTSKTANVSKPISIPNEEFSDDTTPSVARKFINEVKSTIVTLQRVVKQRMTLETHNWSSSAHQELHKIVKDEIFPIVNQVDAIVQNFDIQFLKEASKFVGDFKSLAKEADESLAKHKALELEIERFLRAVVSQDIMSVVQNNSVGGTSNLQTKFERTKERFENCVIKKENEYAKLWNDWYKKCEECKFDKISYDKAYNDMQQKVKRLQAQLGDPKGKITSNSIPIPQGSKVVKNDKVVALGMFRINPFKTSREEKHVPNIVRASVRTKPITISQPPIITKKVVNSDSNGLSSTGVDNTKTRRPQPRSNTKIDRVPSASKSSCNKNKEVEVEEHHRKLLLSRNKKHMSSECNNVKLATQNVKVVCAMCKQCLNYVNHGVCLLNYVNRMNSCGKKQKANVSINKHQKKQQSKVIQTCLWYVDSSCSKHMTRNIQLLINFYWKFLGTVRFGNDHVAAILGFGDLQWGNILITRVYFVEGLGHNLFSIGQFCDLDLEVAFRRNECFVRNLKGVDLLKGNRTTNLYTINLHDMASASPICLMAHATSTKSWLWHQRLSHLNFDTINDLAKNDLVSGLPKFKYHKEHLCSSCEQGKIKRASHPPKPVPNSSQRSKDEAPENNVDFSRAPLFLWPEAIAIACFTQNRSIIHRRFKKTSYELINSRKPDISFLHEFGALCYPKNDREDIGKLGAKGDIGFFIGYSADSCAFRVYNRRTKKIMETMNVSFDELLAIAFEQRSSKPRLQSMTSGQISSGLNLIYASSTITTQQPTEGKLDLLFEAMYDDYIGGQTLAAQRNVSAAHAQRNDDYLGICCT